MTSMCHVVGDTIEHKTEKIILARLGFMFQKDETENGTRERWRAEGHAAIVWVDGWGGCSYGCDFKQGHQGNARWESDDEIKTWRKFVQTSRAEGCLVWEGMRWGQCGQVEWWGWLREGPGEQGWGRCQRKVPLEGWAEGAAYVMWAARGSFQPSCKDRLRGPLAALHWHRCRSHHTRLCSCLNTYLLIPSRSVADKSLAEVEQPTLLSCSASLFPLRLNAHVKITSVCSSWHATELHVPYSSLIVMGKATRRKTFQLSCTSSSIYASFSGRFQFSSVQSLSHVQLFVTPWQL